MLISFSVLLPLHFVIRQLREQNTEYRFSDKKQKYISVRFWTTITGVEGDTKWHSLHVNKKLYQRFFPQFNFLLKNSSGRVSFRRERNSHSKKKHIHWEAILWNYLIEINDWCMSKVLSVRFRAILQSNIFLLNTIYLYDYDRPAPFHFPFESSKSQLCKSVKVQKSRQVLPYSTHTNLTFQQGTHSSSHHELWISRRVVRADFYLSQNNFQFFFFCLTLNHCKASKEKNYTNINSNVDFLHSSW